MSDFANTPAAAGFSMPAEWAPHAGCWMMWPSRESLWGEGMEPARRATAEVAQAIARFEPVRMLANADQVGAARRACGEGVSVRPAMLDDSWARDTGPSFLLDDQGRLGAACWRFNGWGGKYLPFDRDAALGRLIASETGARQFPAPFVLEGGAISVDGEGTLITTEQCLLNPNRNPGLGRDGIEALLKAFLGVRTIIWLGEGLAGDETDGHVDNVCAFVGPGRVVLCQPQDRAHPDAAAMADNLHRLSLARDAAGRAIEVIPLPMPKPRRGGDGVPLTLSYANFYIANGGIVVPGFGDPADAAATAILARLFPDREVVQPATLDIAPGGGNIHCITQQQPLSR